MHKRTVEQEKLTFISSVRTPDAVTESDDQFGWMAMMMMIIWFQVIGNFGIWSLLCVDPSRIVFIPVCSVYSTPFQRHKHSFILFVKYFSFTFLFWESLSWFLVLLPCQFLSFRPFYQLFFLLIIYSCPYITQSLTETWTLTKLIKLS